MTSTRPILLAGETTSRHRTWFKRVDRVDRALDKPLVGERLEFGKHELPVGTVIVRCDRWTYPGEPERDELTVLRVTPRGLEAEPDRFELGDDQVLDVVERLLGEGVEEAERG